METPVQPETPFIEMGTLPIGDTDYCAVWPTIIRGSWEGNMTLVTWRILEPRGATFSLEGRNILLPFTLSKELVKVIPRIVLKTVAQEILDTVTVFNARWVRNCP